MSVFEQLNAINVNSKVEQKKTGKTSLSYLSWSWAWAEFKKVCPTATYEIKKYDDGNGKLVPYLYDTTLGIMVFTSVTVDDITYEMWLPVMDGANKAMKFVPYTYKTKFGEKSVEPASMFDVNKTIMRCLVKNLAMFGLGLYIYSGEDLPDLTEEQKELEAEKQRLREIQPALNRAEELGYPNMELLKAKTKKEIFDIMTIWKATEGK
uniref:E12 n=1 Tax=Lactococcus phage bIL66M1 TaxID=227506 RepID=Q858N9_9CAUD|nr:E12 [Lactococcus phage bIL66M1]